jgi:hypothetical protein
LQIPEHFRPIYKVNIKNPNGMEYEFNSWYFKDQRGIKWKQINKLAIYVDRDLGKKLDVCLVSISLRGGELKKTGDKMKAGDIKIGAEIKVYLGYAKRDDERMDLTERDLAFVGIVDEVSQSFKSISITAFSMAYKIIFPKGDPDKFKGDEWKKEKSSKQIITTLLDGKLPVDSKNFKEGMKFKEYTADKEKTIYDNIKELADYNGFNFYISKDGKVRFHKNGSDTHTFKYGEDILENSITMSKPAYDSVEVEVKYKDCGEDGKVVPYEPIAGSKTANNKKSETKTISFGLAGDMRTAERIAKNILSNKYISETGEVKVLGYTKADLGSKLDISFPVTAPGASELSYMERKGVIITRISHRFGKKSGFTTLIGWKKEPSI